MIEAKTKIEQLSLAVLLGSLFLSSAAVAKDKDLLLELEHEVQGIKEDIFKAKVEMKKLEDQILKGTAVESKAMLQFLNEAETIFTLKKATFLLNEKVSFAYDAGQDSRDKIETAAVLFDRKLEPGEYKLNVELVYQGNKDKKILKAFKYFQDKEFFVKAEKAFYVPFGKTTSVTVTAKDLGYIKEKFDERIQIKIGVSQDWEIASGQP